MFCDLATFPHYLSITVFWDKLNISMFSSSIRLSNSWFILIFVIGFHFLICSVLLLLDGSHLFKAGVLLKVAILSLGDLGFFPTTKDAPRLYFNSSDYLLVVIYFPFYFIFYLNQTYQNKYKTKKGVIDPRNYFLVVCQRMLFILKCVYTHFNRSIKMCVYKYNVHIHTFNNIFKTEK